MKQTAALAALLGWLILPAAAEDHVVLSAGDPAAVAAGAAIYANNCASCHGANLEGQADWMRRDAEGYLPAPPHDASGHTWHHADAVLFRLTKHGLAAFVSADYRTRMPAFGGVLTDAEIINVLSFIKARWPEDIRARHDGFTKHK